MAAQFCCESGTFTLDQCLCGQAQLEMYDPLAQIALRPSLREGTILCYKDTSVEGLLAQLQASLGADNRTVKTNPFYWTEKCNDTNVTFCVLGATPPPPAAGATVTVTMDPSSLSPGGLSMAREGYRVYFKELNGQGAIITDVTGNQVTFKPINNEVLDLTQYAKYTVLMDPLRMHVKCDTGCIPTNGFLYNFPYLRKAYIQKFEKGYCVNEDELDGYTYENEFFVVKGIDPYTGRAVENYCIPQIINQLLADWTDSHVINTLFGQRDDVSQTGFNGLVPTARTSGMYNRYYDPASSVSFIQIMMGLIKDLRRTNGCNEYMLLNDMGFEMDWSSAIAGLVAATSQSCNFSLFGRGGQGVQNFEWFQFKQFSAFGYKFATYLIDAFDSFRYASFLQDFALLLPACKYKDTNGKIVPAVTTVNIEGCEPAKQKHIQTYDERQRGCRQFNVFLRDSWGLEIHCPSRLGILEKAAC